MELLEGEAEFTKEKVEDEMELRECNETNAINLRKLLNVCSFEDYLMIKYTWLDIKLYRIFDILMTYYIHIFSQNEARRGSRNTCLMELRGGSEAELMVLL